MAKRPYKPTPLQVLTRDFNWEMGNLRRLEMASLVLDADLGKQVRELIYQQMDRRRYKFEAGQMAIKSGNLGGYMDKHLHRAILESRWHAR